MSNEEKKKKAVKKKVTGTVKKSLKKPRKRPNKPIEEDNSSTVTIELPVDATPRQKQLHKELLKLQAEYHKECGKAATDMQISDVEVKETPKVDIYARSDYDEATSSGEYEQLSLKMDTEASNAAILSTLESNNTHNSAAQDELLQDRSVKSGESAGIELDSERVGAVDENGDVVEVVENSGETGVGGQSHDDKSIESSNTENKLQSNEPIMNKYRVGIFLEEQFPFKTKQAAITPNDLYNMLVAHSSNTDSLIESLQKHINMDYTDFFTNYECTYPEVAELVKLSERLKAGALNSEATKAFRQNFSEMPEVAFRGSEPVETNPLTGERVGEISQSYVAFIKAKAEVLNTQAKIYERGTIDEKAAPVTINNTANSYNVNDISIPDLINLDPRDLNLDD